MRKYKSVPQISLCMCFRNFYGKKKPKNIRESSTIMLAFNKLLKNTVLLRILFLLSFRRTCLCEYVWRYYKDDVPKLHFPPQKNHQKQNNQNHQGSKRPLRSSSPAVYQHCPQYLTKIVCQILRNDPFCCTMRLH